MFMAADIGGTKALFALFEETDGKLSVIAEKKYLSREIISLEELVGTFLMENCREYVSSIQSACFSLAGPIHNEVCHLVNLNLTINLENLRKSLSAIPIVKFCNDVESVAHGISLLSPHDLFCLTPEICPSENTNYNKAVIAPGTGLGESLIMEGKHVYPTEGAHTEFGPQSEEEVRLWLFLHKKYGHVSYERLLSGPGLVNIYHFLKSEQGQNTNYNSSVNLQPWEISEKALKRSCPLSIKALDIFVKVLGAESGNLALKSLALGGVYLGGGILPKIIDKLKDGTFITSFRNKGRFSSLMKDIPLYVIMNQRTALLGAAHLAAKELHLVNPSSINL